MSWDSIARDATTFYREHVSHAWRDFTDPRFPGYRLHLLHEGSYSIQDADGNEIAWSVTSYTDNEKTLRMILPDVQDQAAEKVWNELASDSL